MGHFSAVHNIHVSQQGGASSKTATAASEASVLDLPPFVKHVAVFLDGIPKKVLAQAAFRWGL